MSMTKECAISLLRRYRGGALSPPQHYCLATWTMYEFGERVYTQYIVEELIKRIRGAPTSIHPLEIVRQFYSWTDDIMIDSQNPITKRFTETIYRITTDISEYLWIEEDCERHRGEIEYYHRLSSYGKGEFNDEHKFIKLFE